MSENIPTNGNSNIVIDRGSNGGPIEFQNKKELVEYLKNEIDSVSWLGKRELLGSIASTIQSRINDAINPLINGVNGEPGKTISQPLIDNIQKNFRQFVVLSKDTPEFEFVLTIKDRYGLMEAVGALAGFIKNFQFPQHPIHSAFVFGISLSAQYREGLSNDQIDSQKTVFQRQSSEIHGWLKDTKEQSAELTKSLTKALASIKKRKSTLSKLALKQSQKWDEANTKLVGAAIKKIEETDKTYSQFMQLKAAVDYWGTKAKKHEQAACKWGWVTAVYAGVVLIAVCIFAAESYSDVKTMLKDLSNVDFAPLLFLGSIALSVFTILFWAGRIFVRIYLSEHHLAIDARQREVMTKTYLALVNESAAGEEDRTTVLTALFRPTTDGIVKDDAAPLLNLASILSKQN